jgi:hypothetical protein
MVQVASLFNQLLQQFPRTEFAGLVKKTRCRAGRQGVHLLDAVCLDAVSQEQSTEMSVRVQQLVELTPSA